MSADPGTFIVGLAIGGGGAVIGFCLAAIMFMLHRIMDDLDAARAARENDEEAITRLRDNLGRRRGRRASVGPQQS